jgi:4-hydroxy-tetrahydrodipicolinate reductase
MNPTTRLLIHGASGRMGAALLRLCREDARYEVVGAVSRKVGQRVVDGVPQFAASELQAVPAFDVAIDFSLAEAFDPILALCLSRGVALVSGTTGLGDVQRLSIQQASARIPVLWASNFSLGVAVLAELVARAAQALPGWDCDIVGEHTVQFSGQGERIELIHRATNRDIFARGALHAATRLAGRAPGNYGLRDLLD